ncbi:TPA: DUF1353 domain-containing protein [Campylobacter jejuni]|nr:DUF1353 domain-containing protein [Campylobacter jejuni]HDZ5012842.1 DUF1353 domain-containing protein [Campylobacter jejuni]HDZ5016270.1 DUF1353 domain-containing protein [Campylobacter jejuni]HDZ5024395.1 DUF1353 domain-containing protein [Campylobacter jejuni]HDZ5032635.1 DUF1353 domain-containing protein [Campylobacter jejuni]
MTKTELKRVCVKPFDKDRFEVISDYAFSLTNYKGIVPKGFKTDGASIPRLFWSFFPPFKSEYFSACVIHDWLCEKANSKTDYKMADLALKEAMQALEINKFKIFVFYHSCNIFHKIKCLIKGIR